MLWYLIFIFEGHLYYIWSLKGEGGHNRPRTGLFVGIWNLLEFVGHCPAVDVLRRMRMMTANQYKRFRNFFSILYVYRKVERKVVPCSFWHLERVHWSLPRVSRCGKCPGGRRHRLRSRTAFNTNPEDRIIADYVHQCCEVLSSAYTLNTSRGRGCKLPCFWTKYFVCWRPRGTYDVNAGSDPT